jgi:hypothetical protein
MKKCNKCNIEKSFNEFSKNINSKDGHQHICKTCKKILDKSSFDKNKIKWIKHYKIKYQELSNYANNIKSLNKCLKCGESRYWVLDFHHLDSTKKEMNVNQAGSLRLLKKEIEKCIILCSNCHRDFHHLERNNNILEDYLK